jgi:hypothetical protein
MTTQAAADGPAQRIASGYAVDGQALELGTVVIDGQDAAADRRAAQRRRCLGVDGRRQG